MDTVSRAQTALPLTPRSQRILIDRLYGSASWRDRLKQSWRPYLAPFGHIMLAVPEGACVMDIGCGGGLFLMILAVCGRITAGFGFDASAPAIASAQTAARHSGVSQILRFEHRSVETGLPSGEWPVVSMIDVMHHVPKLKHQSLIRQLPAHVAPGGRLIIREPVRRPYWRNLANMVHDLIMARQLVYARDPEEVENWLADSGLKLVEKRRTNVLWYGYWLLVYER